MAYSTTTSRSYLTNPTADFHRNNSASTLTSTLGNGTGPWGKQTSSIWNNDSFVPRTVADKSQASRHLCHDTEDVKKGSGSLLATSESDPWRPNQSRGDSAVRIATQPLHGNNTTTSNNHNSSLSPTTARAPAVNLTNNAFASSRPSLASAQPASFFFGGHPPNVYTKYKDHQSYSTDSVISPTSTAPSPTNDRRPQWPSQFRELSASRDQSRAPQSSHSDRQSSFPVDYTRQRQTQPDPRTPSISSQSNGSYSNLGAINPEYLPAAFNQMHVADRPLSRQQFGYDRPAQVEQMDDSGRFMSFYNGPNNLYSTPSMHNNLSYSRMQQDPQALEFRPGQNFQVRDPRTHIDEFVPAKNSWPDSDMTLVRRPQQTMVDPRLAAQVMALKDQYMYNPYALQNMAPYMGYYHMGLGLPALPGPPLPDSEGLQSAKLYDFKLAGKKSPKYELRDIYDHIAEFAGDQHGSRFIQNKLETATSEEKERVFREIEPNAIPLMTDVFGNYVIQKFFDHGHQEHKKILAHKMRGQVLNLSTQTYGCRVVQKALEHVLLEQQAALVGELRHHVLACLKDQNGNHVIQKAIERCPSDSIAFIYQAFIGQVHNLSFHAYGCRVIQRCLERHEWYPAKDTILAELRDAISQGMIGDNYGNYVVQHVVENGPEQNRQHVLGIVLSDLEGYSKHKFASNVVEKCIQYSDDAWRRKVVEILTTIDDRRAEGHQVLVGLIRDSFGNYVIQKLLDNLSVQDFVYFHQHLEPAMDYIKHSGAGKQVVSIEKRMLRFQSMIKRPSTMQLSIAPAAYQSTCRSAADTPPPLTADSRSMQSSGVPSLSGDAVEGATSMSRKGSEAPIEPVMR